MERFHLILVLAICCSLFLSLDGTIIRKAVRDKHNTKSKPGTGEADAETETEGDHNGVGEDGGTGTEGDGTGGDANGGTGTEGDGTGGDANGGTGTEGDGTGGDANGGTGTEGDPTGGDANGGTGTEGDPTGGDANGGTGTEGDPTGGDANGGAGTEGDPTGGDANGGTGTEGDPTGGDANGGTGTEGVNTGDDANGESNGNGHAHLNDRNDGRETTTTDSAISDTRCPSHATSPRKPFTGPLFNEDGEVTKQVKDRLQCVLLHALRKLEFKFRDIIKLAVLFHDYTELESFLQMAAKRLDEFEKLVFNPTTVEMNDLNDIVLDVIAAIEESKLKDILMKLPKKLKKHLCERLLKDETNVTNTRKLEKHIECEKLLEQKEIKEASTTNNLNKVVAERRIGEGELTEEKCEEAFYYDLFASLTPYQQMTCPTIVLKRNYIKVAQLRMSMVRDILLKRSKPSNFTKETIEEIIGSLKSLQPRDIEDMDLDEFWESLDYLKREALAMSADVILAIQKRIKEKSKTNEMSDQELVKCLPFIDNSDIEKMKPDALFSNIEDLDTDSQLSPDKKLLVMSRLKNMEKYKNPHTVKLEDFLKLANFTEVLKERYISKLTISFKKLMSQGFIKRSKFRKSASREVFKKCKAEKDKPLEHYTKVDVEQLGKLIGTAVSPKDLKKIPANVVIKVFIARLANNTDEVGDMTPAVQNTVLEQIEASEGGLEENIYNCSSLVKRLPVRKCEMKKNLNLNFTGDTKWTFECSRKNARCFYKRIVNTIGVPDSGNGNYTKKVLENFGSCMCGIPKSHLKDSPVQLFQHLLRLRCLRQGKKKVIVQNFQTKFKDDMETLSDDKIQDYLPVLKQLVTMKSFMEKLEKETQKKILNLVSAEDLEHLSEKDQETIAEMHMELEDKRIEDPITSEDPVMVCGLKKKSIENMNKAAMEAAMPRVCNCMTMGKDKRRKYAENAARKFEINFAAPDTVTAEKLVKLCSVIIDLPKADLDKIPQEVIRRTAEAVKGFLKVKDSQIKQLKELDSAHNFPKMERKEYRSRKRYYLKLIKESTQTEARRRKRSSHTLTCEEMELLGAGVTTMTEQEIEAMSDTDFLDCASFLGGFPGWTTQQLLSLLMVATRAGTFGNHDTWSADDVLSAGIITQGLSSTQISELPELNLDAMYSMGRHDGWGETQRSAGFERWLFLNKGGNPYTITATELLSLGHFACGAKTNQIGEMNSTIYSYAASDIGELTSCAHDQLIAYANLAKVAFGNVATWDNAVIATVGGVIGGLHSQQIASLTDDQVEAIEPTAIEIMPPYTFVGFTLDHLRSFSMSQSQATTAAQQAGLSAEQRSALAEAGAILYSSAPSVKLPSLLVIGLVTMVYNLY